MSLAAAAGGQIAIVGMACRLPGAPDPAALWRLLERGESAVGEIPDERFELAGAALDDELVAAHPGMRFGAFLDQVDRFDAAFFGISPREAAAMDPQQRLVLELGWEALEDAGIAAGRARAAAAPASSWAPSCGRLRRSSSTGAAPTPSTAHTVTGPAPQHDRQPALLPPRPARAERDRRHGLLVVARRGAPRLREPAQRRVRRWRWPAASTSS